MKWRDFVPHVVSAAAGSAKIPEGLFHVAVWVAAAVCEGLFQSEYVKLNNQLANTHWSWPIMHGSIITFAIPLVVVLIILFLHIMGQALEKGEIYATITAVFPTSTVVSMYFMFIQFFYMVLLELNGSTVDFGRLPHFFTALVFFKLYLSHVVSHQIEMGAKAKIHAATHHGLTNEME